ncbi:MAG: SH3 domain-containing protein [Cytophagaceae bacterium]|nr:MAG: SH3 domain-containing protein [Cytophagaceae bacterium]
MSRFSLVLALAAGLASCHASSDSVPATAPTGASAPAAGAPPAAAPDSVAAAPGWPAPFAPAAGSSCPRTVRQGATIRTRPAAGAPAFGLASDESIQVLARTASGWVGFDPHTAQAANVGIFRLRWVAPADLTAGPACPAVPLVAAPPAGCLLMAGQAVLVRAQPAANSPVVSTIPAGSYAEVVRPGSTWVQVRVPGRPQPGYVAQADVSFTGPCQ